MKKQVKILTTLLLILTTLSILASVVSANPGAVLSQLDPENATITTSGLVNFGSSIVAIIQTAGVVIAVVVLLILGVKYLMGSAEEKAEYKKTMVPYVVGAILIFAASTIVNVVYQLANSIK